jgi:kynurenine formamidase
MNKTIGAVVIVLVSGGVGLSQETRVKREVTKADLAKWKQELSNWGRWGKDDQRGAVNLITPSKRQQAAALVKEGYSVSLSRDLDTEKSVENTSPFEHTMLSLGMDRLAIRFHGYAHSHMDSLSHVSEEGVFYNGYKPDTPTVLEKGHARNSIHNIKDGIFTRGILVDVPSLKGVPFLEPGTRIYVEDLEAWEKRAGVRVAAGDALLIYTGRWVRREKVGAWPIAQQAAGLDASVIPWLKQRDVALLGGEASQDAAPPAYDLGVNQPVHNFCLVYLGVHIFDALDLTAVAQAAAARKRWDFLLTLAPLAVRGGTGSPVNPIATF